MQLFINVSGAIAVYLLISFASHCWSQQHRRNR